LLFCSLANAFDGASIGGSGIVILGASISSIFWNTTDSLSSHFTSPRPNERPRLYVGLHRQHLHDVPPSRLPRLDVLDLRSRRWPSPIGHPVECSLWPDGLLQPHRWTGLSTLRFSCSEALVRRCNKAGGQSTIG